MIDSPVDSVRNTSTCPSSASPTTGLAKVLDVRDTYVCARAKLVEASSLAFKLNVAKFAQSLTNEVERKKLATAVLFGREDPNADSAAIENKLKEEENKYQQVQKDAENASVDVIRQLNTKNIAMAKWRTQVEREGSAGLGQVANVSGANRKTTQGVLILGDLRVVSVVIGVDFLEYLKEILLSESIEEAGIVTYAIQAKHVAYVQEIDSFAALQAQLELTVDQIAKLSGGAAVLELFKNETLKLQTRLTALAEIGDQGVVSNPHTTVKPTLFCNGGHFKLIQEQMIQEGYASIYSVWTTPQQETVTYLQRLLGKSQGAKNLCGGLAAK